MSLTSLTLSAQTLRVLVVVAWVIICAVSATFLIPSTNARLRSVSAVPPAPPPPSSTVRFDFDGDGKADVGRFSSGESDLANFSGCKVRNSSNGTYYDTYLDGTPLVAPGEYDSDSKTDCAAFSGGHWIIRKSTTGLLETLTFGTAGDIPVSSDYDGDGTTDLAIYRPSSGEWHVRRSIDSVVVTTSWGSSSDRPVPGDYDGDGKSDRAFFRANGSNGEWHILKSSNGQAEVHGWGVSTDTPVLGDFDGFGKSDLAVFRPSSGSWFIYSLENSSQFPVQVWGNYGDQPAPADYDGDGKSDISVWRPHTGEWHIIRSSDSGTDYHILGVNGDIALPSAYTKQVGGGVTPSALTTARVKPRNTTGDTNLYSQNFAWGTTLAGLPGRAGLDASLTVGYNSLTWINVDSVMVFDPDLSNVAPGFRMGLPTIEPYHFDASAKWPGYLMVTETGQRYQFRQFKASKNFYTADSNFLHLKILNTGSANIPIEDIDLQVTYTDGTAMVFDWILGAYRCISITDRNGNVITANYNASGDLTTLNDTLGRTITIAYDSGGYPITVSQQWQYGNGSTSGYAKTVATFSYVNRNVNTSFSIPFIGPPNGYGVKVLDRITYVDGSSTKFTYNDFIQVTTVENFAPDNHLLNRKTLEYTPASGNDDVPRLTRTDTEAENFNNGSPVTVVNSPPYSTTYSFQNGQVSGAAAVVQVQVWGHPNWIRTNYFYGSSGWIEGLPIATQDCTAGPWGCTQTKRWTWNNWTQDDPGFAAPLNPRVIETRVGDDVSTLRTVIDYESFGAVAGYSNPKLPKEIRIYDSAGTSVIKKSVTTYNMTSSYTSRRLLGLPSKIEQWGKNDVTGLLEKVSDVDYEYDGEPFGYEANQIISPINHNSAYGSSFVVGRGNVTKITRNDVTGTSAVVENRIRYDVAGSVVAKLDPLGRKTAVSYSDSFNDGNNSRNTFAYPTKLTDPAGYFSTIQYRFDVGLNVQAASPNGKTTSRLYDDKGRIEQETLSGSGVQSSYTRYAYPLSGNVSKVFSTLVDADNSGGGSPGDEVETETHYDGAGRVIKNRVPHTFDAQGNPATWSATKTVYDILGRVVQQSVPTEVDANWNLIQNGDDTAFLYNSTEYDWKGRPIKTWPTDSNGNDGKESLYSYVGCGCAGGQVTTVEGPLVPRDDQPTVNGRRRQKVYEDILGRVWKTENLTWDSGIYSTSTLRFNGRDQVLDANLTEASTSVSQVTTSTYDGHGRLLTRRNPIDENGTQTTWSYNADDTVLTMTDPRGAVTSYSYGNPSHPNEKRKLVIGLSYTPPSYSPPFAVPDTPDVTFAYDSVGNRTSMTDGSGSANYVYDSLSRMTSETKTISGLSGNFTLTYAYQIGGKLKSITDPFGATVNYVDDKSAKTASVTGNYANVSTYASGIQYRAFGGVKQMNYGSADNSQVSYGYDAQQRVANYQATSTVQSGGFVRKASYEYFDDSRVKKVNNLLDAGLSQNYKFDAHGRLVSSISGQKLDSQNLMEEPFTQSIGYNAFNDMTSRVNHVWGDQADFTAAYLNGRKTGSGANEIYDKAGNIVDKTTTANKYERWKFDAAGRNVETVMRWHTAVPAPSIDQTQTIAKTSDGDGLDIKRVDTNVWFETFPGSSSGSTVETEYYIRSSLLDGQTITKLDNSGAKRVTLVYNGKAVLAEQRLINNTPGVYWRHEDFTTGSYSKIDVTGQYGGHADDSPLAAEYDPLGGKIEPTDPTDETLNPANLLQFKFAGDVARPEYGCYLPDIGVPAPCNVAAAYMNHVEGIMGFPQRPAGNPYTTAHQRHITIPGFIRADNRRDDELEQIPGLRRIARYSAAEFLGFGEWVQDKEGRPLNDNESKAFRSAWDRALELLKDRKSCRDAIAAILKNTGQFLPDHAISLRNGMQVEASPTSDFVFDRGAGASRYLDTYTSVQMTASGKSGVDGNSIEYGITRNGVGQRTGLFYPGPIVWNREFFSQGLDERALSVIHEIVHQFDSDINIANFVAGKRGDKRRFSKTPEASQYWNNYLAEECGVTTRRGIGETVIR